MEAAAARYLATFKQITTINGAGAAVVVAVPPALWAQSAEEGFPVGAFSLVAPLAAFAISLLLATLGMLQLTRLELAVIPIPQGTVIPFEAIFPRFRVLLDGSAILFFNGLALAALLFLQ